MSAQGEQLWADVIRLFPGAAFLIGWFVGWWMRGDSEARLAEIEKERSGQ